MSTDDLFATVSGGIEICYRTDGDPAGPPVVLIAGLSLDLTFWPDAFVDGLTGAGFRVIRFDNRDAGRSTHVATPPPGLLRQLLARPRPDAYELADMAGDTIGLLDHLGLDAAHLVGMSLGGMVAQTVAARHSDRVRTLTSIFSTTGSRRVGQPARSTMLRFAKPPARTSDQYIAGHLSTLGHIGSTEFPFDEEAERAYAAQAWRRGGESRFSGRAARQIGAIQKSGDRTTELARITAPTLVVHGDRDLMIHPSGGAATTAAITGARQVVIPGMRHHIGPTLAPRLVDLISAHVATVKQPGVTTASTPGAAS